MLHKDFDRMYAKYNRLLFSICYKIVQDVETAQELTQEAFTKAYISYGKLRDKKKEKYWLCQIATRLSLDRINKERKIKEVSFEEEIEKGVDFGTTRHGNPEQEFFTKDLAAKVYSELKTHYPTYYEILLYRYYFDFSPKEIAMILDMPVKTVYTRLKKGGQLILQIIEKESGGKI